MTARWVQTAVAVALLALSSGCASGDRMWRDQYVFVGDGGHVLALVLQRRDDGNAEAKAWVGGADGWRTTFYHRFSARGRSARDPVAALAALSASPGSPVRATAEPHGEGLTVALRTRSSGMRLQADALTALGTVSDPEGVSEYRTGRATLTVGQEVSPGWLVVETTPARHPRRAFVDFGDFVFLVAANPERGPIVIKRSDHEPAFDAALALGQDRVASTVDLSRDEDRFRASVAELGTALDLSVRDRDGADGVAPDGAPVRYQTLLLGGEGWAGVAFTIRPGS